jgi:hypothetical protein
MVNDISLVGLDARLGRLEALHRFELAGMPEPNPQRDSLAPSPDYRVSEPPLPDPEPCSCEEAEALRLQVAALMTDLAQTRADYQRLEEVAEEACNETVRDTKRLTVVREEAQRLIDGADSGWYAPIGKRLLALIEGEGA